MKSGRSIMKFLRRFRRKEDGVTSIEICLAFPIYMIFFLMIIESGLASVQQVMLERAVDLTTRDVRIGRRNLIDPSREQLKAVICARAVVPDCANQLNVEVVVLDLRAWGTGIPSEVRCVDRGNPEDADNAANSAGNNRLVFIRACARIDPLMPTTGLGKAIFEGSKDDTAAQGSYGLVAIGSFVVEPYRQQAGASGTGT